MPLEPAEYKTGSTERLIDVLRDIRTELRRLNEVAYCNSSQAIPDILRRIEKAVTKS